MWKMSTVNVKIDAICEKITLNVKKLGSLNVSNILTLNVLKSTLYVQTLFWRYLWNSNFNAKSLNGKNIYPLHLQIEKICLGLGYQSTQCICMWIWIYMYNAQIQTMLRLIAIDLINVNVTFGQLFMRIGATKMFRYRFIGARRVILSNAENDSNFT